MGSEHLYEILHQVETVPVHFGGKEYLEENRERAADLTIFFRLNVLEFRLLNFLHLAKEESAIH